MGSKILYSVSLRLAMPFIPFKYAKELDSMANAEKTGTGRFKTLPNTTKLFRGKSSFGL